MVSVPVTEVTSTLPGRLYRLYITLEGHEVSQLKPAVTVVVVLQFPNALLMVKDDSLQLIGDATVLLTPLIILVVFHLGRSVQILFAQQSCVQFFMILKVQTLQRESPQ